MLDYNTSWQSIYQYYYAGLEQCIHRFIDLMTHEKNDAQLEIQALSNLHYYLTRLHQFLYCHLLNDVMYLNNIYDASGLCVET